MVAFEENPAILRVTGDEDRSTQGSRRRPMSRALKVESDLVVDLSGLAFADTSVIVDLAQVACRLRRAGRRMLVRGAAPQIAKLIELVGLHRMPGVTVEFA